MTVTGKTIAEYLASLAGLAEGQPIVQPWDEPIKESGGYRVAARIEVEEAGETRSHQMIRADVFSSKDEATTMSVLKAKLVIDQQGRVLGINTFVNPKAEFGYASHIRYLRELVATASGAIGWRSKLAPAS